MGFSLFLSNILLKKRNISYIIYALIAISIIANLNHYFSSQINNKYSIYTQKKIAKIINKKIQNIDSNINKISLSALPHHDDRKGVEYILLTRYKIQNYKESRNKFLICYSKECFNKDYKLIYNNKDIRVFNFWE